ncbi:MAG: sulfatase [Planctomycetota bacterium JB042]
MIARAAALAHVATVAACSDAPAPRPPDIVLLTVDTLRADRVGAMGHAPRGGSPTPLADALAARGAVFTRCYVPRGQTHPSLASMLTGKFPITHGLRDNGMQFAAEHVPFPVLLKRRGYRTAAFCSNLDRTRWPFWLRGFDVAEDGVEGMLTEEGARGFETHATWDERTVAKALRWIEALPRADPDAPDAAAPFFLWVHLYDAHQPFTPSEEARDRFADPGYDGPFRHPRGEDGPPRDAAGEHLAAWALGDRSYDADDLAAVDALYDAGVADVDARLARVTAALEATGRLDDAMVLYSSDHGEELGRHHGYFGHGNSIYDAVLHVPLIVAWPGRIAPGTRVDGLCQNLDLFPTLLEAAGAEVPADTEGRSLLPLLGGAPGRPFVYAEWEDLLYSISDGTWKAITNPRGAQPRKPPYNHRDGAAFPYACFELYHLADDPGERRDLHGARPAEEDRLHRELREFLSHPSRRTPLRLPDEVDAGLEALGYVGSTRNKRDVLSIECGEDR